MSKKEMIQNQLTKLAFQESIPFCYSCYIKAPTGRCDNCGSDDLMLIMDGVGCEYDTDWVIEHILKEHLEPVNQTESFEDMIEGCYPTETKVGWLELSTVDILRTMDEVAWDIAKDEYISSLEEDEEVMSFDNSSTYFWTHDIENLIEEKLKQEAS
ncbi:MAG: hypothetical protein OXM55_04925 [Bdellovibrionales bacterium]|nr:hypothetical protein [Bdellovibrionales bacterium]